jgi:hypothetical protein
MNVSCDIEYSPSRFAVSNFQLDTVRCRSVNDGQAKLTVLQVERGF